MLKKILIVFTVFLIGWIFWYRHVITYGLSQFRGQLKVVRQAKPIEDFLEDPTYPRELKDKIKLIQEIRQFATDSLGLKKNDNYKTLFEQQGKPVLWNLTASPLYTMEAYQWDFPIIGKLAYRAYFDYEKAVAESERLTEKGYETQIDEVKGWSTLGWFDDPILSGMLDRTEGSLANLIIHELAFSTLYIRSNVQYNENLATFVGDRGTEKFLAYKYGRESEIYQRYIINMADYNKYSTHILKGADLLDSLYKSFDDKLLPHQKQQKKEAALRYIVTTADTISFHNPAPYREHLRTDSLPGNPYFMQYRRYRLGLDDLQQQMDTRFDSDLKKYVEFLSKNYEWL
jgi:predicted aminopeptidase